MNVYEEWMANIPCQFRDKPNISAVVRAFARQIEDLKEVNRQLREAVDIDTAHGVNLDMLGTIVNVTRKDAYVLMNREMSVVITDEMYRNVLRFQALKNNSDATYADIMKGLYLLWGKDVKIKYAEAVKEPACIEINIADITTDETDPALIRPMVIRPGGVKLFFRSNYLDKIKMSSWEMFGNIELYYIKYHRYNGAFQCNGAIMYCPEDVIFTNRFDGEFQYNRAIQYKADNTKYVEYNGEFRYNGLQQYGAYFERKVIKLGDAVLLNQAKRKMLKMRYDGSSGWKIAGFAFGIGLGDDGKEYEPSADQIELRREIYRKDVEAKARVDEDTYRYTGGLSEIECNGRSISEIGLYDTDGMLLCIKTFPPKKKNKEAEMIFKIDDMC